MERRIPYAFGPSQPKKEHAKEIIQSSLAGLLLLLAIWIILHQINPDILNLNILQNVKSSPAPSASGPAPASSAPNNSFLAPNQDSSLDGCGVSGCGDQSQQFAPGLF